MRMPSKSTGSGVATTIPLFAAPLAEAFTFAAEAHAEQTRKGTNIPYLSHLMTVCALVVENGGTLPEATAALLHDVVEDTKCTFEDVEKRFGSDVAAIVRGCTDADTQPKPPWRERKAAYLKGLKTAPE